MTYQPTANINLSALSHNLKRVRDYAPEACVMAMIKANAYGHGLLPVAKTLAQQADALGVARLEEALLLRNNGISCPIRVMLGFVGADELRQMSQYHITPVIHTSEQIELLETTPLPQALEVWLKIDTGMHRLGFSPEEALAAYQRLNLCKQMKSLIVLMTHFASADELSLPTTSSQMTVLQKLYFTDESKSSANSAAIIARPDSHQAWVRPGIMLYGVSPFADGSVGNEFDLKPVMTLRSQIVAIHDLQAGDAVGYGGTWICPDDSRIGVAAIGYGDGYPRHAKNGTPVLVNGVRCSLAGRVSMDLITIDLRHCPQTKVGDPVVLWGEGLPIEEVAVCADTIAYELLCHVTSRVSFEYFPSSDYYACL